MHLGSCHCGAVKFQIDAPITELTTCDCSLCRRKNALMTAVPEATLTVLEGQDMLTLYQWNTQRAMHYFCRRCGIYVFHRKRMQPDHFGINVQCLEDFDAAAVPVRATRGGMLSVDDPSPQPHWRAPRAE